MKKPFVFLLVVLVFQSCIPLRVAPIIEDYKVTKGKKFKRGLPKREMFVFEDFKDANEFYNYVNVKFNLEDMNVENDVPFYLNGKQYFFSFYEVEISDKALNILPVAFDIAANISMDTDEFNPILSGNNNGILRQGNWYVAIECYSDNEKDSLAKNAVSREMVLTYMHTLKQEYVATDNYNELIFKK